jgi:hypothetical protein
LEELHNSPELQARARNDQACAELGPATGQSAPIEELIIRNSLGRRMFVTSSGKVGMTAVEGSDDSSEQRVPNFDGQLGDSLGRSMLSAFQAHLAERNTELARITAEAMQGKLPGQRAPGVRSGDFVVALVGGFQPYVLRPESQTEGLQGDAKYAFVGECHLQGAMDGECLVDPNDLYGRWKQVPLVDVLIV